MPLRTSARSKEMIKNEPPAHPSGNITPRIVTEASSSRPQRTKKSNAIAPNTVSVRPANHGRDKGGKNGKLVLMTIMPMDIVFEIFAQLEPLDLLHLSRASKDLRNILLSSDACFLWKLAYQNLSCPPPTCPPGVNLRYYTNFLYGQHCHFCASVYGAKVFFFWSARVRLCRGCIPTHMMNGPTIQNGFASNFFGYSGVLTNQYGALEREALSLCARTSQGCTAGRTYVLKMEYDRVLQALKSSKDDAVALAGRRMEQQRLQKDRNQHGYNIKNWWVRQEAELAANLMKRKNEIVQRIEAEGFGTGLDRSLILGLKSLGDNSSNFADELSDHEWEKIKPRLIRKLEYKKQRLRGKMINKLKLRITKLSQFVAEFYSKPPKPFVIPPIVHFARKPPFVGRIKNTTYVPIPGTRNIWHQRVLEIIG